VFSNATFVLVHQLDHNRQSSILLHISDMPSAYQSILSETRKINITLILFLINDMTSIFIKLTWPKMWPLKIFNHSSKLSKTIHKNFNAEVFWKLFYQQHYKCTSKEKFLRWWWLMSYGNEAKSKMKQPSDMPMPRPEHGW